MTGETDYSAVILGGGVSGMVAASLMARQSADPVLLVEEYAHLGGNHLDVEIDGRSFDIGSFFFYDDSALIRHFPGLLAIYQDIGGYKVQRLTLSNGLSRYPFDPRRDLIALGPVGALRVLASVIRARLTTDPTQSAGSFATYWLGRRFLHGSGLYGYLQRFYGADPEEIEAGFAQKRMGWIANNARFGKLARQLIGRRKPAPAKNRAMVRPVAGFAPLYDEARRDLQEKGVEIRTSARAGGVVRNPDRRFTLSIDGQSLTAKQVISTIPLNRTLQLCGLTEEPDLRTTTLTSLFYSFAGQRGFEASVLYNFSARGLWKRLTVHSDFYGEKEGRIHFSLEAVANGPALDPAAVDEDFRAHVGAISGLFEGDLRLEGAQITENAYPTYLSGAEAAATRAKERLAAFGISSFGRQGGFDYQPTADVSADVAEKAIRATSGP